MEGPDVRELLDGLVVPPGGLVAIRPATDDDYDHLEAAMARLAAEGVIRWTVLLLAPGTELEALDEEQMRLAGWVRADASS
jgi:hypothetical protein